MRIGSGPHTYEWVESWARIPDTETARTGWAHSDAVVTRAGEVITFHQGEPRMLVFGEHGDLLRSWQSTLSNAHGMDLVQEGETEYLWQADNLSGQVIKTSLQGEVVLTLKRPDHPAYREGRYSPTSVAVNQERHGGNGDVWVADGYGESYVHRFSKAGDHLGSINGQEGRAGAFDQPHAVFFNTRNAEPELYVADRRNGRVQVYDADGAFKRAFGSEFLQTPGAFDLVGEFMVIGEHRGARLTVVDAGDNLVCYLGENAGVSETEGWPNVPREIVKPGLFNSPHGLAADDDGNIYVVEWITGGRTVKLAAT